VKGVRGMKGTKTMRKRADRVVDPTVDKCNQIAAAFQDADCFPVSVRNMLSGCCAPSLTVFKEERHPYQTGAVTMVGEALASIEESLKVRVDEMQAQINGAEAEKVARSATMVESESNLGRLEEALAEHQAALSADGAALAEATKALADAKAAETSGESALAAATSMKEKLESARNDSYEVLKEHTCGSPEREKALKNLANVGSDSGFDTSLLDMMPTSLKKSTRRKRYL